MFCNCSVIFLSTKWTFQTLTPKLQSAGGSTPTDVSLLRDPQIHQWDPGSKRSTATKGATKMRSVTNLVFFVFFSPPPKKKDASFFGRIPKTLMKGLKKGLAEGVCSFFPIPNWLRLQSSSKRRPSGASSNIPPSRPTESVMRNSMCFLPTGNWKL